MGHLSQCALQNSAMTKHPGSNFKKKKKSNEQHRCCVDVNAANWDPTEVQNEKYFHPALLCYCLHNT